MLPTIFSILMGFRLNRVSTRCSLDRPLATGCVTSLAAGFAGTGKGNLAGFREEFPVVEIERLVEQLDPSEVPAPRGRAR